MYLTEKNMNQCSNYDSLCQNNFQQEPETKKIQHYCFCTTQARCDVTEGTIASTQFLSHLETGLILWLCPLGMFESYMRNQAKLKGLNSQCFSGTSGMDWHVPPPWMSKWAENCSSLIRDGTKWTEYVTFMKKHFAFWNKCLWTCPPTSVLNAAKTKHIPTFPGPSKPTAKPPSTSFSPHSSAAVASCWQTAIITAQFAASDNQCWRPTNCFPPISSLGVTDGEGLRVAAAQRY